MISKDGKFFYKDKIEYKSIKIFDLLIKKVSLI